MAECERELDGRAAAGAAGNVHIVIETENVIEAVRSHRLLWDPQHDQYTGKEARRRAWTDICRTLMTDWDKFDYQDQNDIERKVQQRWRTARDSFVKARAAWAAVEGHGGGRRETRRDKVLRSYSHYTRLTFLEETMRAPLGTVTLPATTRTAGARRSRRPRRACRPPPPSPPPPVPAPPPADEDEDGSLSTFERQLLATLRAQARGRDTPLEPDDEHFFRSLGPMLAMLDHRQKLQFRTSVLDVLQREYSTYNYVAVDEREDEDVKYDPAASSPASTDTTDH